MPSKKDLAYIFVLGAAALLLTLSLFNTALGITFPLLVVKSGSMRPLIEVGDIIIVTPVNPAEIRADPVRGDVIIFYRPGHKGMQNSIIVHRAISATSIGYITKGDANNSPDYWGPVPHDHIIGRWTGFSIPSWTGIGYLSLFLRGEIYYPLGPLLVLVLIVANIALIVRDAAESRKRRQESAEAEP